MSFGSRLKDKRKELGITQPQLAELLGVSQSAIGSWETDVNSPRATLLYDLFDILHCDANYLFQDETKELYKDEATPEEFENIIKKYRFISEHSPAGAETVDYILNREYNVANQLKDDRPDLTIAQQDMRTIQYYQRLASAGSGEYLFDDIPTDTITVENTPISSEADFVIGVNGQSMEPTYYDGDLVFVKKASKIPVGEIGIFTKGDECFIKELGPDRLISHNADKARYPDVFPDEEIRLVGLVLGKAEKI